MGSVRALAFALVVTAGIGPGSALAQTAKEKQKASELVKQVIAKSQAGDHDTAVQLYENAFKIVPQPLLLSNIGSNQALEKPVEALKYIEVDAAGGIAIAAGVVLFVLAPERKSESRAGVSFAPVATSDTLGVVAAGRF